MESLLKMSNGVYEVYVCVNMMVSSAFTCKEYRLVMRIKRERKSSITTNLWQVLDDAIHFNVGWIIEEVLNLLRRQLLEYGGEGANVNV